MCLCLCPLRERRKRTAYTFWIHWSRRAFRPGRRGQARDRCRREWRALWLSSPGRPYASSRSPAFRYWSRSSWWRASLSPCGRSESESVFSSVIIPFFLMHIKMWNVRNTFGLRLQTHRILFCNFYQMLVPFSSNQGAILWTFWVKSPIIPRKPSSFLP